MNQLQHKRIALGAEGTGTRAFVAPLLAVNGVTPSNSDWKSIGGGDALRSLKAGEVDIVLLVGGTRTASILDALRDPEIRLMSSARTDAYVRRFPYITKLSLPQGSIDFALDIPAYDKDLLGTKAMLVARPDFHPALINLLVDAATEIHSEQGYFEAAGEFPGTQPVDIPVSTEADRHKRFGPGLLQRYLPFWIATLIERLLIPVIPLAVVLIPLARSLPQFRRWRVRSRIYRWYGELAFLERDVATRRGELPIEQWLQDLSRIESSASLARIPPSFVSEVYTLREHIGLVRRAVLAKAAASVSAAPPS